MIIHDVTQGEKKGYIDREGGIMKSTFEVIC